MDVLDQPYKERLLSCQATVFLSTHHGVGHFVETYPEAVRSFQSMLFAFLFDWTGASIEVSLHLSGRCIR